MRLERSSTESLIDTKELLIRILATLSYLFGNSTMIQSMRMLKLEM